MQHLGTGGKGTTYEPKSLGDRSDTNFLPCRVTSPPESLYITLLLSKHKLLANGCHKNLNSPQEYSFEVTILTCKKMSSNQPRGLLLEIIGDPCLHLSRGLFSLLGTSTTTFRGCLCQAVHQSALPNLWSDSLTCLSLEKFGQLQRNVVGCSYLDPSRVSNFSPQVCSWWVLAGTKFTPFWRIPVLI